MKEVGVAAKARLAAARVVKRLDSIFFSGLSNIASKGYVFSALAACG